jgi:hypothetical protein
MRTVWRPKNWETLFCITDTLCIWKIFFETKNSEYCNNGDPSRRQSGAFKSRGLFCRGICIRVDLLRNTGFPRSVVLNLFFSLRHTIFEKKIAEHLRVKRDQIDENKTVFKYFSLYFWFDGTPRKIWRLHVCVTAQYSFPSIFEGLGYKKIWM